MIVHCPYCGLTAKFVSGDVIYPHRKDLATKSFFHCAPCGAWVGTHEHTLLPLGRLANAQLRAAKQQVHAAFDPLWQEWKDAYTPSGDAPPRVLRRIARTRAYLWLAHHMEIAEEECHVGMFDLKRCELAIEVIRIHSPNAASIRAWAKAVA